MLRAWTRTCFEMSEASPLPEAPPADTLGCSGEPSAPRSGPGSVPWHLMPWHGNTPCHAIPHHAITHHAMPHSWGQHTGHTKPSHVCQPCSPVLAKGQLCVRPEACQQRHTCRASQCGALGPCPGTSRALARSRNIWHLPDKWEREEGGGPAAAWGVAQSGEGI